MIKTRTNERGAHLLLIIIVIVAIAVAGLLVFVFLKQLDKDHNGNASLEHWKNNCQGQGTITLQHSPMDIEDIDYTTSYGLLAAAHVTPIDHLYFYGKDLNKRDTYPVYAMADGYIVEYQHNGSQEVTADGKAPDGAIRIIMQHTCTFYTYFDLMTSLSPEIYKKIKSGDNHVKITAGQEIGRVGAQSLDTAVYNLDVTLKGFIHSELYTAEPWKIHTDDFYERFGEPLQSQLLALNVRKVKPYSGKIDYDIAGKLIGNWFLEGTNGYAGPKDIDKNILDGSAGYYSGHFSITPDASGDENKYNVSFGDYNGKATQFSIKQLTTNPSEVGISDGPVKYEYTNYQMPGKNMTQTQVYLTMPIKGTIILQVLEGEKMKMEYFDGKTADQVSGFTTAAKIFER